MTDATRLIKIMSGEDRSMGAGLSRCVLACLEWPYRAVVRGRHAAFDSGVRRPRRLGRPTVSVGNLTTGGPGKTPMVIEMARRVLASGIQPAVLLRGYRPGAGGSDEAAVLTRELGAEVPVEANADRVAGAGRVLAREPGIGVFILDDGFQHRQVHRDVDVVLIDAMQPFGFGHVLPRGMMREPIGALRRADAIIVTRADSVAPELLRDLDRRIEQITGRPPLAHASYAWDGFAELGGKNHPGDLLRALRVVGVSGVGNPEAFERDLAAHAGEVAAVHRLPDHHGYSRKQVDALIREAKDHRADALVTTHKDAVKWEPLLGGEPTGVPIYYPHQGVRFVDGHEAVDRLLDGCVRA
jgi:tetraacyldisaccharide 4'-kinase